MSTNLPAPDLDNVSAFIRIHVERCHLDDDFKEVYRALLAALFADYDPADVNALRRSVAYSRYAYFVAWQYQRDARAQGGGFTTAIHVGDYVRAEKMIVEWSDYIDKLNIDFTPDEIERRRIAEALVSTAKDWLGTIKMTKKEREAAHGSFIALLSDRLT